MNRYEKQKKAVETAIGGEIEKYKAIYKKAEEEDRDPTDEERLDIESHLKAIETLKREREEAEENIKTLQHVDDIGRSLGPAVDMKVGSEPHDRMFERIEEQLPVPDMGSQFVRSEGYKSLVQTFRDTGRLPTGFTTGPVNMQTKGTLGESQIAPVLGGYGLVSTPQVLPGIVETLYQRLTFADLVLSGQTTSTSLRYVVEGTATNAAAAVGEGSAKPESALGFTTTDESISKIATFLPVTDEMIEDAPVIQGYINGRLTLFVQIEEERQLLRGLGVNAEIKGLLAAARGVPVFTGSTATHGNVAKQLFWAINSMRGSAFQEADWVIMHPTNYQTLRLLEDSNGQLYGGGPFVGPYGVGGQADQGGAQLSGATETVWGKQVHVTSAAGVGTAIIGTRANAQVFRRGGLTVEATNSHASFFAQNLIAIRAESRLGLAVYRPAGYVVCTIGS
jgi:HK97 family phage major capsid protein